MARRWDSSAEFRSASQSWQNPPRCGYCRKRSYDSRSAAKRALRALYPAEVGASMTVYECVTGGHGFHIGHRGEQPSPAVWPAWAETTVPVDCDRCPATVRAGDPVASQNGDMLCFDCGDLAEREALAARQPDAS